MRNISRVNAEIKLACTKFGQDKVYWPEGGSWIEIIDFPLPPNLNKPYTNLIIIVPENYGYGAPFRDIFINSEIRAWNPKSRKYEEIPHYFQKYPYSTIPIGTKEEFMKKNWRYLCIHEISWHPVKSNILSYLDQVRKFLADPFKDWGKLFNSYKRS